MIILDKDLINELGQFPWFENCGKPISETSFSYRQLENWEEVKDACAAANWLDATEEAQGELTEFLSSRHPSDYQGVWNRLAKEARGHVNTIVLPRAESVEASHNLGQSFIDAVKWEVLHGIMEISYSSKNPPGFFEKLMHVYRLGHYPCGLEDETLIVY